MVSLSMDIVKNIVEADPAWGFCKFVLVVTERSWMHGFENVEYLSVVGYIVVRNDKKRINLRWFNTEFFEKLSTHRLFRSVARNNMAAS